MSEEAELTPKAPLKAESRTPRGLGRGLSALIGEAETSHAGLVRGDIGTREIGLDLIVRNKSQPRRQFHEDELQTLAESLKQHGILQPLLLRPLENGSGKYEIVAGERRWRAAQLAGLHSVPALIRNFDDLTTLEVSIVENVQRADLNPIEEAMAFQQLVERFGRTQQAIADAIGRSRAHVSNTIRLLTLPESVQNLVKTGEISAGHARAIIQAPDPFVAARLIIDQGLSVRDAEKLASNRDPKMGRTTRSTSQADADSKALAHDLSVALGLEVGLTHKNGAGGALTIHYRSLEQLDDLCRRLTATGR
ncbi:ParB/RepB/Spo0J family partition protein [Candidatus Phycosocius spiralis]|uniref:Chromosome-partitioning protein ParB n=1 Tax=Candidatus Phycosocius spiralis TaxID=2815099 RepID=A0ABQ4PX42_9PROT|nr:ParB/RepB/Spo0J family partition protein [Candidatus Phycosocius spiralis]GIU67664.1 chromosome-partitioning protein ParB [Candidatus Phycosocius spiralis]